MRKNLSKILFALFLTFLLFQACRNELDIGKEHQHPSISDNLKIRKLIGDDAKNISNALLKHLQKTNNQFLLNKTLSGEIDYSEISEAIDNIGISNYTFRILNHPDDNFNTFHNLVLSNENGEFNIYLMKYEMDDTTAEQLRDSGTLNSFEGMVTSSNLGGGDGHDPGNGTGGYTTCNPSITGTGGGGGGTGSGGGGSGTSTGGGYCSTMSISCNDCGRIYGSIGQYGESACNGYPITIYVSYIACRQTCNPGGGVVVSPPKQTTCEKIKAQRNDENFKKRIDTLQGKTGLKKETGYIQKWGGTYEYKDNASATVEANSLSLPEVSTNTYIKGFAHTHVDNYEFTDTDGEVKIKIGIKMSSPADIAYFMDLIQNAQTKGHSLDDAFGIMISSMNNYQFRFTGNEYQIKTFTDEQTKAHREPYRKHMEPFIDKPKKLELGFLQYISEKMNLKGITLYRMNSDGSTTEIKLNADKTDTLETTCPN